MPRTSIFPNNAASAEILRTWIERNPTGSQSQFLLETGYPRSQVFNVRHTFDIQFHTRLRRNPLLARGALRKLFEEAARQGITRKRIAHELGRTPNFIWRLYNGTTDPRQFDIENFATLLGMELTLSPVRDKITHSNEERVNV